MVPFSFILFAFFLLVLTIRPFTVLFHELGHAIPAILMTRQSVSIYIGSYADPKNNLHVKFGRLNVWIKYNPFSWQRGLCIYSGNELSINKQIICLLGGPLASFSIAIAACNVAFFFNIHGSLKLIVVIFLGLSISDLFTNIIPRKTPIKLHDGSTTHNDGYRLRQLLRYKRFQESHTHAVELYNQQKFAEAALLFEYMLKKGLHDENIYRWTIHSFLHAKNYTQAKELSEQFLKQGKSNSDDFANAGVSYSHFGQHDQAIACYDKSLELNPDNKYSLNNKGFSLIVLNKFEESLPLFDRAIEIDQTFAYSYNNRGLAKIKIGNTEEGLDDILHSFKLDENNSYCYRNLGIYHFDKGEYSKAMELFKKARELDSTTYMIDELINDVYKSDDSQVPSHVQ